MQSKKPRICQFSGQETFCGRISRSRLSLTKRFKVQNELQAQDKYLSSRELELYEDAVNNGARPISASLSKEMLNLFVAGSTCLEIQNLNQGITEKDVVYCRVRNRWDEQREEYVQSWTQKIKLKLLNQKLESLDHVTNIIQAYHKSENEQLLRYIQTGKEEDKPKTWIHGSKSYKETIEILQKLTGEDRVQKIKTEQNINVQSNQTIEVLTPELQDVLLKRLSGEDEQ